MNTAIEAAITTMNDTLTLLHVMPLKLPSDQLCRFTMSESFANVMMSSVIALQI